MSIKIVGASAGTGKTEYLCRQVLASLTAAGPDRVSMAGLVAVTYTRKAEAELRARIRRTLIRSGAFEQAQQLPVAYIGTVHAVCLRLLKENAIVAGLSMDVDVMPDDAVEAELSRALESAFGQERQREFEKICSRIRPNWNAQERRYNWIADAADLIELVRSNRIDPSVLPAMANRSIDGLLQLLPTGSRNAQLDTDLQNELSTTLDALERAGDEQKNTQAAISLLSEVRNTWRQTGQLPWMDWLRLTKIAPAKAHETTVARLKELAVEHEAHPRFRRDLEEYVRGLYAIVEAGLETYARWKDERGVVDYVDMEERALRLLDVPEVTTRLKDQLELIVVDEFQDTSPIQLQLFTRLDELAGRSIWVGDRKQSIFSFRGADPMLMDAVVKSVTQQGERATVLSTNYRSRASVVNLASDLFVAGFQRDGYTADEVRAKAERADGALAQLAPISYWVLDSGNQSEDAVAVARGISRLVSQSPPLRIEDREARTLRAIMPFDIAVLAPTNDQVEEIATALDSVGLPSVVRRAGLLQTPEGTFLRAAIRLVVSDDDYAAIAQIEALTGFGGNTSDAWLEARVAAYLNERSRPPPSATTDRLLRAVEELRDLSPLDVVDEIIRRSDLCALCAGWTYPAQRLANLDAFRALTTEYVNRCRFEREAVSLSGLLRFLDESERDGEDRQHAVSDGGVHVCTYHRAKGLEWPVVILSGLDTRSRAYGVTPDATPARLERGLHHRVFAVTPESDRDQFDPSRPLDGRWIRFWPWPYGSHQKAPLAERAENTDEARRAVNAEARESLRLFYVGFTRARDHIVVAGGGDRDGGLKAAWLGALPDDDAIRAVPRSSEPGAMLRLSCGAHYPAAVWRIDGHDDSAAHSTSDPRSAGLDFAVPANDARIRHRYRISPSSDDAAWSSSTRSRIAGVHRLGARADFNLGIHEAAVAGEAVHAFLASDRYAESLPTRTERAKSVIDAYGMGTVLAASSLVDASDAFRRFVEGRWPGGRWHREVPIAASIDTPDGTCRIDGKIDLLVQTVNGWVVIDHKSYPGAETTWPQRALEHAAQLAAYRRALLMAGANVAGCFIHFTIGGGLVELQFDGG